MPLPLRVETMPDNPRRVAFFKGPILLAGDLGSAALAEAGDVPVLVPGDRPPQGWLKSTLGKPLQFELAGEGRPGDVSLVPFFRVSDHRYVVYWELLTPVQWADLKRDRDADQARRKAIDDRTLDLVQIGNADSEAAHGHEGVPGSNTGNGAYGTHMETHWRDAAGGWFSYELKVVTDQPVELLCTYWGKERGDRIFDILVDGQTIATTSLDSNHPAAFYERTYEIDPELSRGKNRITVRFLAHPGNIAGGLFGLRTLRQE